MCPEVPQKRQSLLIWCCHSCGVSFPSFPSFKERLGVVDFFCSEEEPLPWVELELLFFCLELEEPLPDLCSDLFPEDPEAWVSWESSPFHSQYCASIAWMSFWSPARVFGLLWWTILSLILWRVHCKPDDGVLHRPTECMWLAAGT